MAKLSSNYALSRVELSQIQSTIIKSSVSTLAWGVRTADLVKMQQAYTDEIGRSVILTEDNYIKASQMATATGLGVEGVSSMIANMELFGVSISDTYNQITRLTNITKRAGVSSSVASKKFQDNLKIANSYTFKDGVKGVIDMTSHATKLRIEMRDIAALADKVSSPEGAIETAARLQVLGGSFASMADPMRLLHQGINDIEGLTKTYTEMLNGLATVNRETGEVTVDGYDRLRIKAAAEAQGVSFENMMTSIRTKAKRDAIESTLSFGINMPEETKDLIASLAQFDSNLGGFTVNIAGKGKLVTNLDENDIKMLQPEEDSISLMRVAENTLGVEEKLGFLLESFQQRFLAEMFPKVIGTLESVHKILSKTFGWVRGDTNKEESRGIKGGVMQGAKGVLANSSRGALKMVAKKGGKQALRFIPGVGSLMDVGFAINDAIKGD